MMQRAARSTWLCATIALLAAAAAQAQGRPDSAALQAAQRTAMQALSRMDGMWRGEAKITMPDGQPHVLTQTERIGPMLGGTIKVIEGRGYDASGAVSFNAFAVVSYDPAKASYSLQSHAQGLAGSYALRPTPEGYDWEIPAGPMTIRYSITIKDNTWREVGERVARSGEAVRFFDMTLKRIGDTDWPAAGAVPPK